MMMFQGVLLIAALSGEGSGVPIIESEACPAQFKPVKMIPPRLGGIERVFFAGEAKIGAWVSPFGHVESPVVLSANWSFIRGGSEEDANRVVLRAIRSWRYPKTERGCGVKIPIKVQITD